jgi:aerobic-type carbon monoxide dehydrogenase small subunit (CoxS/CutS family)
LCTVNGQPVKAEVESRLLLSDFLRHRLRLTGTHVGCEQGSCGACTVVVDGVAVRSCLMLAVMADGVEIETVEGLSEDGELHPVQEAFAREHALQCGFCTPGIVMSVCALRQAGRQPSVEEVNDQLGGHLCRCTGYQGIREAARSCLGLPRETEGGGHE